MSPVLSHRRRLSRILSATGGALCVLVGLTALPAVAQPVSSVYQIAREAGASPADAAGLAAAMPPTQEAQLIPDDAANSDFFGYSVSLSGDRALIGSRDDNDDNGGGNDTGSAYVFVLVNGVWTQEDKLVPSDPDAGALFGYSVSLSGDRALIGARDDDSATGAAYVFVRSGSTWTQETKITTPGAPEFSQLGASVSLSGDRALIGASSDENSSGERTGAAYVFVRSGSTWMQEAKLSLANGDGGQLFGEDVSLLGDRALVGARGVDVGNGNGQGSAYVFTRSGSTWTLEATLIASDGEGGDNFGASVSLSSDRALIGAPDDTNDGLFRSGSAYVFSRSGSTWTQEAKLTASDAEGTDFFGTAVSLSGDRALVGARNDDDNGSNSGAAYVFARSGSAWSQEDKILADNGARDDLFGLSVSLLGNRAFIGAPRDRDGGISSGAVYVFSLEPGPVSDPTVISDLYNPSSAEGDGAGFRMLGVPVTGFDVTDLAALNLVQGIAAGTNPTTHPAQYGNAGVNLFTSYDGNGAYSSPDADDVLEPGRGFFWYLYDASIDSEDVPASFGTGTSESVELTGFALRALGTAADMSVTVPFADNAGTDDFHLLANPFARPLAVDGITVTGGMIQGTDVFQTYDPDGGTFVTLMSGDRLSVWQGVFAELVPTTPGGTVTVTYAFDSTDEAPAPPFYGRGAGVAQTRPSVRFALAGTLASGASVRDRAAIVRFSDTAEAGWDALDASKKVPPAETRALVAPVGMRASAPVRLAVDSRPIGVATTVPLAFTATEAGSFALSWTTDLPAGWSATLTDRESGQTLDLASATEMAFATTEALDWTERFTLRVTPDGVVSSEDGSDAQISLSNPYPNPASRRASLTLTLDQPQHIRASVTDALGREVAVLLDAEVTGETRLNVDTEALAPGVYVVRVQGADLAETRRLTVVR